MLHRIKSEILEGINHLFQLASKGRDNFPDEICKFLINQFEFQASVLFKYNNKSKLVVIGKSPTARKNFLRGSSFSCNICKNNDTDSSFSILSDSNCDLQISEFVIYESCISFKISNNEKGLLKIANKSPFSHSDTDDLKKVSDFIGFLLQTWASVRGDGSSASQTGFKGIIGKTAEELRTPANSIIGFTSILAEDNITSSQSKYVSTIKENAQNILLTINDLNDLTKIETGKMGKKVSNTRIDTLINEVVDIFNQKNLNNNIKYNSEFKGNFQSELSIDIQKLRYILNTLLTVTSNLSGTGLVNIDVNLFENNILSMSIGSTSVPLNKEKISSLVEPYGVSTIETLKNSNITGLSLPLALNYATLLGGSLTIEPNDSGLLFNLKINFSAKNAMADISSQLPKPTEQNKILVVEDDYATSKLMSSYLNKWGYDPIIVNSEEQTLSLIEKEKFLAVILDIEIPNANGLELLRKINTHPATKNTPVIVCSIEAEQQKAYLMGAVEYFVKPINYNYLVEILTSYKLRKNSNILCVDDDVPTLNLIKQAIETAGFNAVSEHISANVMELIKDKTIDLAILDLDMPHPNGFELIKLIKSDPNFEKLPIIIYTGKENFDEDLKQIDGLFEHLLSKKSTNIEDLAETIEAMVNRVDVPPIDEVIQKSDVVKILLAEDYKHSQIIVTRLLKKNTFENVVVVENGEDALNIAQKEHFDLILMDMQMPIMNGFEATEKLRQIPDYKETPIIALTAFAMKGDREKCLQAGATDYIPKPIDSKEFIEKVKYYTSSNG